MLLLEQYVNIYNEENIFYSRQHLNFNYNLVQFLFV